MMSCDEKLKCLYFKKNKVHIKLIFQPVKANLITKQVK
jgi:hypothetical protein